MKKSMQERFPTLYQVDANGCWIWQLSKMTCGYGRARLGDKWTAAHRLSWHLAFGPIPTGQMVLHRCDNRPCVNPDHLFLGTAKDNTQDMIAKGRDSFRPQCEVLAARNRAKTHCKRGHAFSPDNTRTSVTRKGHRIRVCRTCDAMKTRERRASRRSSAPPN